MTKLQTVRQALEANPDVVVVTSLPQFADPWLYPKERVYLPKINPDGCVHKVYFYVAPRSGLFTASELNAFMMGLVPINPYDQKEFMEYRSDLTKRLSFGKLYFDERVGEKNDHSNITIEDEELLKSLNEKSAAVVKSAGFVDNKRSIDEVVTQVLRRRICVSVFPNDAIAIDAYDLDSEREVNRSIYDLDSDHSMRLKDLKRYKLSLLNTLLER